MNIQPISEAGRLHQSRKNDAQKGAEKPLPKKVDRAEISSKPRGDMALESIKAKVNSGYYNSNAVIDDISDKLANLFERGV